MTSKLTILEFRERLADSTAIGHPKLMFSPFGRFFTLFASRSKTFYGLFDETTFRLTANAKFSMTPYIIKGTYKKGSRYLEVNYKMEPGNQFTVAWFKFFPFFMFVIMSLFFYSIREKARIGQYIGAILIVVFVHFFGKWMMERKKKKLERKFIQVFELE